MPAEQVPAHTPVKRNRVGNIDTDRLVRRQGYLVPFLESGGDPEGSRADFGYRAAELRVVEDELERRGEQIKRKTNRLSGDQFGN